MRLIIEARIEGPQTGPTATASMIVDEIERQDQRIADLGLTLPKAARCWQRFNRSWCCNKLHVGRRPARAVAAAGRRWRTRTADQ